MFYNTCSGGQYLDLIFKYSIQISMKRGNIFGIDPKVPGALQSITNQIGRVLSNPNNNQQTIEIEIKYAQFKYFSPPLYNELFSKGSENQKKTMLPFIHLIQQQRYYLKDSLKKTSHQYMIKLNDLGRAIYALNSCFDEARYQKFYHMRQFLIKQCQFNDNFKNKNILLPHQPKNIYHQFSLIPGNADFQMTAKSQIRLDIIVKDPNSKLNGRYSYSNFTKSWIKTKKQQLIRQQIDLMLSQKTFRFAINNQVETEVCYQDLQGIRQEIKKRKFKQVDIRLKKTLRCTKGGIVEFSLSEVYEPQKENSQLKNFIDLQEFITEDSNVLDNYVMQKFQHFYEYKDPRNQIDPTKSQIRHEIECQITKKGMKTMKQWTQRNHLKEVHYQIQQIINNLYNLFYADHSIRTHEAPWLDKIMSSKQNQQKKVYPNQRLVNEFGSYMHNIIFQEMTKLRNQ